MDNFSSGERSVLQIPPRFPDNCVWEVGGLASASFSSLEAKLTIPERAPKTKRVSKAYLRPLLINDFEYAFLTMMSSAVWKRTVEGTVLGSRRIGSSLIFLVSVLSELSSVFTNLLIAARTLSASEASLLLSILSKALTRFLSSA